MKEIKKEKERERERNKSNMSKITAKERELMLCKKERERQRERGNRGKEWEREKILEKWKCELKYAPTLHNNNKICFCFSDVIFNNKQNKSNKHNKNNKIIFFQMSSWVASGRTGRLGANAPRPAEAETLRESGKNFQVKKLDHFSNKNSIRLFIKLTILFQNVKQIRLKS
jgi:hypothetical protein